MSLFGPDYRPLLDHYEKLTQSLRVELNDVKEAARKREEALHEKLMVLTNPQAVKVANSSQRFVGVMRGVPPQALPGQLEDEFDGPDFPDALPEAPRPRDISARIFAAERADVEAHRAAAEARRAKQSTPPKPSEPQPS